MSIFGTSYLGDPLNVGGSMTVKIFDSWRRAIWRAEPLKSILNFSTSFTTYVKITTPTCFSHTVDFDVSANVINDFLRYKFNGDNGTPLFRHTITFVSFCDRHDVLLDDIVCGLFSFTFEECTKQWCHTLPTTFIHSFDHMIRELWCAFVFYERKELHQKNLKLWKALDKSIENFYDLFLHYYYEFLGDEVHWKFWREDLNILFTSLRIGMS